MPVKDADKITGIVDPDLTAPGTVDPGAVTLGLHCLLSLNV